MGSALAIVAALLCLGGLAPLSDAARALLPPGALLAGAAIALVCGTPQPAFVRKGGRILLQTSVVLLGFSVDFGTIARAGAQGFGVSALTIAGTFALGIGLARRLKVRPNAALLVAGGTAICGGSAIAALASVVDADAEDTGVAAGTVFLLNAVALLLFPALGHALGLTQTQFGLWAGVAIHDVASVVGAGTAYGPAALATATAVKLARVLFLVPVTLLVALAYRNRSEGGERKVPWPWFVGGFVLASLARGWIPGAAEHAEIVRRIAGTGFALSLLAVGLGFSRPALARVGVRPLTLGVALWVAVALAGWFLARGSGIGAGGGVGAGTGTVILS